MAQLDELHRDLVEVGEVGQGHLEWIVTAPSW
jgi:hypothetical protein